MSKLAIESLVKTLEMKEQTILTEMIDQLAPADPQLLKIIVSQRHRQRIDQTLEERDVIQQHNSSFADPSRIGAKLAKKQSFYKNFKKKDKFGKKKQWLDPIDYIIWIP